MTLLLAFISIVFIGLGILQISRMIHLRTVGKVTEAIVFKNNVNNGGSYPVVRFLTENKEWITQELTTGYSPAMPEGTKLDVIYDPSNPSNTQIHSSGFNFKPWLFLLIGVFFGIWAVLNFLREATAALEAL